MGTIYECQRKPKPPSRQCYAFTRTSTRQQGLIALRAVPFRPGPRLLNRGPECVVSASRRYILLALNGQLQPYLCRTGLICCGGDPGSPVYCPRPPVLRKPRTSRTSPVWVALQAGLIGVVPEKIESTWYKSTACPRVYYVERRIGSRHSRSLLSASRRDQNVLFGKYTGCSPGSCDQMTHALALPSRVPFNTVHR